MRLSKGGTGRRGRRRRSTLRLLSSDEADRLSEVAEYSAVIGPHDVIDSAEAVVSTG